MQSGPLTVANEDVTRIELSLCLSTFATLRWTSRPLPFAFCLLPFALCPVGGDDREKVTENGLISTVQVPIMREVLTPLPV
jgi:hypothetical protein